VDHSTNMVKAGGKTRGHAEQGMMSIQANYRILGHEAAAWNATGKRKESRQSEVRTRVGKGENNPWAGSLRVSDEKTTARGSKEGKCTDRGEIPMDGDA